MGGSQFNWAKMGWREYVIVALGFIALGGLPLVISSGESNKPSNPPKSATVPQTASPVMDINPSPFDMRKVNVDMRWSKGGFDTVMVVDLTITNESTYDVKDLDIRCSLFGNSGTQIGRTTRTLYEVVPAGSKKTFRKINMGFIGQQAASASCEITDLKVIR